MVELSSSIACRRRRGVDATQVRTVSLFLSSTETHRCNLRSRDRRRMAPSQRREGRRPREGRSERSERQKREEGKTTRRTCFFPNRKLLVYALLGDSEVDNVKETDIMHRRLCESREKGREGQREEGKAKEYSTCGLTLSCLARVSFPPGWSKRERSKATKSAQGTERERKVEGREAAGESARRREMGSAEERSAQIRIREGLTIFFGLWKGRIRMLGGSVDLRGGSHSEGGEEEGKGKGMGRRKTGTVEV